MSQIKVCLTVLTVIISMWANPVIADEVFVSDDSAPSDKKNTEPGPELESEKDSWSWMADIIKSLLTDDEEIDETLIRDNV